MNFQNGSNPLLNMFGGTMGLTQRLNAFANTYNQTTNRPPEEVGREIQSQIPPEQFQQFAAIADMIVGRRR